MKKIKFILWNTPKIECCVVNERGDKTFTVLRDAYDLCRKICKVNDIKKLKRIKRYYKKVNLNNQKQA